MLTRRTRWRRAGRVWKVPFSCHNLFEKRGVIFPALQPWNVLIRRWHDGECLGCDCDRPLGKDQCESGSSWGRQFPLQGILQKGAEGSCSLLTTWSGISTTCTCTLRGMHKVEVRAAQAPGSSRGLPPRLRWNDGHQAALPPPFSDLNT